MGGGAGRIENKLGGKHATSIGPWSAVVHAQKGKTRKLKGASTPSPDWGGENKGLTTPARVEAIPDDKRPLTTLYYNQEKQEITKG